MRRNFLIPLIGFLSGIVAVFLLLLTATIELTVKQSSPPGSVVEVVMTGGPPALLKIISIVLVALGTITPTLVAAWHGASQKVKEGWKDEILQLIQSYADKGLEDDRVKSASIAHSRNWPIGPDRDTTERVVEDILDILGWTGGNSVLLG